MIERAGTGIPSIPTFQKSAEASGPARETPPAATPGAAAPKAPADAFEGTSAEGSARWGLGLPRLFAQESPAPSGGEYSLPASQGKPIESPGFTPLMDPKDKTEFGGAPGAYYRKVEGTASRNATGIAATVTLPRFQADPSRFYQSSDVTQLGPMDRPSVYMGSHAVAPAGKTTLHAEADIGLQWSRRFGENNRATFVTASVQNGNTRPTDEQLFYEKPEGSGKFFDQNDKPYEGKAGDLVPHFCFTPFVRIDEPRLNANGTPIMKDGKVDKENRYLGEKDGMPARTNQERYFYAGERVSMRVERTPGNNGKNVNFTVQKDGSPPLSVAFHSNVLGRNDALVSAKRVTSIDQFTKTATGERIGVEKVPGQQVLPTRSTLTNMVWEDVSLLERGGKSRPMTGKDFSLVYGKDKNHRTDEKATFRVGDYTSSGGERITIIPTQSKPQPTKP